MAPSGSALHAAPLAAEPDHDSSPVERVVASALCRDGVAFTEAGFLDWFNERNEAEPFAVRRIALDELTGWAFRSDTGDLAHESGKFFSVMGLRVSGCCGPVRSWSQPIVNQPEVGVLGILVKRFDGVLHCLMQVKAEPGNCNGLQLSPTVQATRSNFTGVHRGRSVPYLEHFRSPAPENVFADVLQSEQGAWFYRKRNRNMVVEVREDVEVLDGFCWLSVGQVYSLLSQEDLLNMDARTVLSCMPFSGSALGATLTAETNGVRAALARSADPAESSRHSSGEMLSWITDARSGHEVRTQPVPLNDIENWRWDSHSISHESGRFFSIMAVDVRAGNREVGGWSQPLVEPHGVGIVAFLARRIDGVLHVLVNARVEPGYLDVVELAPTVQCTPENYAGFDSAPPFLDRVFTARREQVLFDTVLSEEGGRFFHAHTRYLVIESDEPTPELPDYRWMTLHQLLGLLKHSHYINVQARTLITCLHRLAIMGE